MQKTTKRTRRPTPDRAHEIRVTRTAGTMIDDDSTPIMVIGTVEVRARAGTRTAEAYYSSTPTDEARGGAPPHHLSLQLDRGTPGTPGTHPTGFDTLELINSDTSEDITPAELRLLATALEALATEAEQTLPAQEAEAIHIVDAGRALGFHV